MKGTLKIFLKNTIPLLGSVLLFFFGRRVNKKDNYGKRVLIVFGGGVGDVVKRSVICEYVRQYLSGYDIYYLMPYQLTLPYAEETIHFNYKKAKISPRYYFQLVNKLRRIGFSKAIVMFPLWDGFLPYLASDTKPEVVFCPQETEPNFSYKLTSNAMSRMRFCALKKRFSLIKVPCGWDKDWLGAHFPSDTWKHIYFISQVIRRIDPNEAAHLKNDLLPVNGMRTEIELQKEDKNVTEGLRNYCAIGLGSSTSLKNWEPEKFGKVAELLSHKGYQILLVGGPESISLVEGFQESYKGKFTDSFDANLNELCWYIKNSVLVVCNDTSMVHIAIAFKRPTVCVNNMLTGADTHYGYSDINKWVLGNPMSEIKTENVVRETEKLIDYLHRTPDAPKEEFKTSFFSK